MARVLDQLEYCDRSVNYHRLMDRWIDGWNEWDWGCFMFVYCLGAINVFGGVCFFLVYLEVVEGFPFGVCSLGGVAFWCFYFFMFWLLVFCFGFFCIEIVVLGRVVDLKM